MIQRVLLVGLGSIGERHLRLLRSALPNANIQVLRHSGCDKAIEHANGCLESLESACSFSPQLSVLASPAPFHVSTGMALAEVGSHLMIEKPISSESTGVIDLISFCDAHNLRLQVGYNMRFMQSLQVFRTELLRGSVGNILRVKCEVGQYLPEWRPGKDYRATVSAQAVLGGGVLLELSHELDMLRWVFGEVAWLSAWLGRQSRLDIDVEDCAMLHMGFVDGPVAEVGMDFLRRDATRRCTVIGDAGSLCWDGILGAVSHFDADLGAWVEISRSNQSRDDCYIAQIDAFLSSIATGEYDDTAAQGLDGLAVLELVGAARSSNADGGRRVVLGADQ